MFHVLCIVHYVFSIRYIYYALCIMYQGSGFEVWGVEAPPPSAPWSRARAQRCPQLSGFGLQVSGFGFRFRASGFGFQVSGFGIRASGFGLQNGIRDSGFRFWNSEIGFQELGFGSGV